MPRVDIDGAATDPKIAMSWRLERRPPSGGLGADLLMALDGQTHTTTGFVTVDLDLTPAHRTRQRHVGRRTVRHVVAAAFALTLHSGPLTEDWAERRPRHVPNP